MHAELDWALMSSVLDEHDEGVCVFDRTYLFLYSNASAARLLQRTAEALAGERLFELFPDGRDTVVWSSYEQAFDTGEVQEFRLWYGPLEGWFRVRAVPRGDRLVVWFRDVNDEQAVAQERADLAASQERSEARAVRLLDVVAELSRARTLPEVLDVVIERGFGLLGGYGGGVGFVSDDREHLDVLDLRGLGVEATERWTTTHPLASDVPMMNAARTGEPLFYGSLATLQDRYPHAAGEFGERTHAIVALPLTLEHRTIGALVVMFDSEQTFPASERDFMLTLSGLCAQALARARLSSREREIAATLQRSLLPRVPQLPDAEVAVRYVAGAVGTQVGGDWYDVLALGSGRLALVVGDVMGRGVAAAALMGQVRAALRAYALLDLPPAQLLDALDAVVSTVADGGFVTCCYAAFDPADSTLCVASAGHLPPVITAPAGSAPVELEVGPPLGTSSGGYVDNHLALPRGALVALCSDGLVETRTRDATDGLELLAEVLHEVVDQPLEDVADLVLGRVLAPGSSDDTALLLVRPAEAGAAPVAWSELGRDLKRIGDLRRELLARAQKAGQPPELLDALAIVASELMTNAALHGRGVPRVRVRLRPALAVVEVEDGSPALPRLREADDSDEGGRGLELVAALSRGWGWRPVHGGKIVWAELVASG